MHKRMSPHDDFDHMGNAKILIDNFKVKEVIFNCGSFNDLENELINLLEEKNIKYFSCIDKINVNNTELTFLKTREYNNENDNSSVIYTRLNGYKCYVVVELKITELKKEHTGQIMTYMNYIDKNIKTIDENDTVGIIICKQDNEYVIKYCSDDRIIAREYELIWYNLFTRGDILW